MSNTKSNQPSPEHHGRPAGQGTEKGAGNLPALEHEESEQQLENDAQDAPMLDPNRNTDKPDIDKPAYN